VRKFLQFTFLAIFILLLAVGKVNLWLMIFLGALFLAPLLGRFYCGYLCPMKTVMGLVAKVRQPAPRSRQKPVAFWQKNWLPWVVLVSCIALMLVAKRILGFDIPILLVLLVIAALWTAFMPEALFHNYLCPFGAPLRLLGQRPLWRRQVKEADCISCRKCVKVCPADAIEVPLKSAAVIQPALCHQCDRCSNVCPTKAILYRRDL